MNIIETVRKMVTDYPKILAFTNNVHVDFTESEPTNFSLSSSGDTLATEDILGNQTRTHSFILRAFNQAFEDYDRITNSTFLLDLNYWLEKQKGQQITVTIDNVDKNGKILKMSANNAMLFSVPTGDIRDGVVYQIQINADYSVKY